MNDQTLLKNQYRQKKENGGVRKCHLLGLKRIRHPPEHGVRSLRAWWAHGCRQTRRRVPWPCRQSRSVSEPEVVLDLLVFYLSTSPARKPSRAGSSSSPSTNHRSSALTPAGWPFRFQGRHQQAPGLLALWWPMPRAAPATFQNHTPQPLHLWGICIIWYPLHRCSRRSVTTVLPQL
jgi:hypothetical protein